MKRTRKQVASLKDTKLTIMHERGVSLCSICLWFILATSNSESFQLIDKFICSVVGSDLAFDQYQAMMITGWMNEWINESALWTCLTSLTHSRMRRPTWYVPYVSTDGQRDFGTVLQTSTELTCFRVDRIDLCRVPTSFEKENVPLLMDHVIGIFPSWQA